MLMIVFGQKKDFCSNSIPLTMENQNPENRQPVEIF